MANSSLKLFYYDRATDCKYYIRFFNCFFKSVLQDHATIHAPFCVHVGVEHMHR